MTRNMDLLDDEMGTPPPSTVDVTAVIARQRRLVRYRRLGVGASAAVAVLAVALAVPMIGRTTPAGHSPVQPAAVGTTTPTPTRQAEADRLTAELGRLMAAALPDAQFVTHPAWPDSQPLVFVDKGTYFFATAEIKDAQGISSISVSVGRNDPDDPQFSVGCPTDPNPQDVTNLQCSVAPGPDGGSLRTLTDTIGTKDYHNVSAQLTRPDGNIVGVLVSNGVDNQDEYHAQRPETPLTKAEVVALAEEPGLASTMP